MDGPATLPEAATDDSIPTAAACAPALPAGRPRARLTDITLINSAFKYGQAEHAEFEREGYCVFPDFLTPEGLEYLQVRWWHRVHPAYGCVALVLLHS
jgi:hypothetical protein